MTLTMMGSKSKQVRNFSFIAFPHGNLQKALRSVQCLFPHQNLPQRFHEYTALRIRPHRDAQELRDAWLLEVAHDDGARAQCGGELCGIVPGVARKDEVGGRGQHLEAQRAQALDQRRACGDDLATAFLKMRLVLHRGQRAGQRQAVERVGVEAVFHAFQPLDQRRLPDGVAHAQAGERAAFESDAPRAGSGSGARGARRFARPKSM